MQNDQIWCGNTYEKTACFRQSTTPTSQGGRPPALPIFRERWGAILAITFGQVTRITVSYPHICVCQWGHEDALHITGVTVHFKYFQKIFIIHPGATHAPIWVKLNPQTYSVQQQICAKFHPDWSTFGRMELRHLFCPITEDDHTYERGTAVNKLV